MVGVDGVGCKRVVMTPDWLGWRLVRANGVGVSGFMMRWVGVDGESGGVRREIEVVLFIAQVGILVVVEGLACRAERKR